MSRHIADVAGRCPQTRFVIGGYSQGGTVTDIAIGLRGVSRTTGEAIPASLASRVVAVVVFGNPLGLSGRVIETASPTYGPKARSFCNTDDTVCGGGGAGSLPGSHLSYATNGSVPQAADFAAGRING
jgi:cutinase